MRTVLISLAAAASALAVATPAAAQYFPQPQGYAYGWHNSGQARALKMRINAIQRQINHLDRRNILSDREARRLRNDSLQIEHRLRVVRQNGLHPREAYDIERRLAWLENRLWRDARDGNRWGYNQGYNQGYGSQGYFDRDRDGRDDRYEDDRGYDRD
jgi:hypothetical protein